MYKKRAGLLTLRPTTQRCETRFTRNWVQIRAESREPLAESLPQTENASGLMPFCYSGLLITRACVAYLGNCGKFLSTYDVFCYL